MMPLPSRIVGGALRFGLAGVVGAVLAGVAAGQVQSHALPPELPMSLLPSWVTVPPPVESQEVSARLWHERQRAARAAAGGQGAESGPSSLPAEAREAIRRAESGQFKEAAAAGDALLKLPGNRFSDYTWDYLANATAWACIQAGDLKGAALAHSAAATRINEDAAVGQYHRLAATLLGEAGRSADELKNYAAYQAALRQALAPVQEAFNQSVTFARNQPSAESRLNHLRDAYERLRLLTAADAQAGSEARASFRQAAQGLLATDIPAAVRDVREVQTRIGQLLDWGVRQSRSAVWNGEVRTLWLKVQQAKRLCRMYDYLVRLNLAEPGDATGPFRDAHGMLFDPEDRRMVWQEINAIKMLNGVSQVDIRARVPYQETRILPWGAGGTEPTDAQFPGWGKMDPMKPMGERMKPMTDRMKPIR